MATISSFEEIIAWQKAREFASLVWTLTLEKPFARDFALCDQINRSAGSVMDNIAEGFSRGGNREFIKFLFYSRDSLNEVKSQLYRALDRKRLNNEKYNEIIELHTEVASVLSGFIKYLQKSNFKGIKFENKSSNVKQ